MTRNIQKCEPRILDFHITASFLRLTWLYAWINLHIFFTIFWSALNESNVYWWLYFIIKQCWPKTARFWPCLCHQSGAWKFARHFIAHTSLTFLCSVLWFGSLKHFRPCDVRDKVRTLYFRMRCQKFNYLSRQRCKKCFGIPGALFRKLFMTEVIHKTRLSKHFCPKLCSNFKTF